MGFQLVLFAAIAIAIVIAIVLDYIRHKRIVAAEENSTQSSNEFKNLHEFLKHIFDGRVLEYNLNKITESDKAISKIRALQVKLRNSIHANEVLCSEVLKNVEDRIRCKLNEIDIFFFRWIRSN